MKLTVTEYAEYRKKKGWRGTSRRAVYDAIDKGWIKRGRDGRIDVDAADRQWANQSRSRSDGQSVGSDTVEAADLNYHRARKEKELADKVELENAERRGELVERKAVKSKWFALARATRDRMLGLADRCAGQVAMMASEHECRVFLEREIRDALRELAETLGDE